MHTNEIDELRKLLPLRIERLADIAYDIWWSSNHQARSIFRMISRYHWGISEHNPIKVLLDTPRARLDELALQQEFLHHYDALVANYDLACERSTKWFATTHQEALGKPIAYFSAEFGLHSSLPIYSGGLGILAGDHVKTADDLGVPLVAVGFLYPFGYFVQHITTEGEQIAEYHDLDRKSTAVQEVLGSDGKPVIISLHLDTELQKLHLKLWKVKVGTVTLYLMDSDLEINVPEDREITRRLYGGDKLYRLRQEYALGVGGVRALEALGIEPVVFHANEGHSSFLFIERLRKEMGKGRSFHSSVAHIQATSVFTTHTPVPAGHDAFAPEIVAEYFQETINELGISKEQFLSLGLHQEEWGEAFNMTTLAFSMADHRNAVSKKHEEVTRDMWKGIETPTSKIIHVTNGVHIPTWLAPEFDELLRMAMPSDWRGSIDDPNFWKHVHQIPDVLVWHVRSELSRHLGRYIGDLLRKRAPDDDKDMITRGALYNPGAFTIGFARRFATYKRALLPFRDKERLSEILNNAERPVQIIYSGKAHPADSGGKELIKQLWNYAHDPLFRGKIMFLENYSMHTAQLLVRGVDMWLNLPRAPLEASGTSGIKAAINGVPNLSVLDGWWIEAYNTKNGWAIDSHENLSEDAQDTLDAESFYQLLEREIVPMYYNRNLENIPTEWMKVVKESIVSVLPQFSSQRMVKEYVENLYLPAGRG